MSPYCSLNFRSNKVANLSFRIAQIHPIMGKFGPGGILLCLEHQQTYKAVKKVARKTVTSPIILCALIMLYNPALKSASSTPIGATFLTDDRMRSTKNIMDEKTFATKVGWRASLNLLPEGTAILKLMLARSSVQINRFLDGQGQYVTFQYKNAFWTDLRTKVRASLSSVRRVSNNKLFNTFQIY